jgi:adenosylmethionine-8-amino-7-oxononanoate aminotransferase
MNEQRRVVRTKIVGSRVFNEYTVKAYDQFGKRYPECDYFTDSRSDAVQTALRMIEEHKNDNGSHS